MRSTYPDIQQLLDRARKHAPITSDAPMDSIQALPPSHPIFQLADEQPSLPSYIPKGASFKHFTPEERTMVTSFLRMNPDAGYLVRDGEAEAIPVFTPRYPFPLNGQPDEATRRRVYSMLFDTCETPDCGGRRAWWIDRGLLNLGTHCEKCHADTVHDSWAAHQWRRKPHNAIVSDYDGFIANDPMLGETALWTAGQLFHLGSGMRTGKTTYCFLKADELHRANPNAVIVYLGARISQVRGIYAENCGEHPTDRGKMKWGLFCQGVGRDYKHIGTHGAIATISSLEQVLDKIDKEDNRGADDIHIVIDEVDFAANLMNASIMKSLKVDNRSILKQAVAANGIAVAGQTENLLTLERFARELDITTIQGYYKRGNMENAEVVLYEYPHDDGMKNLIIATVLERCAQLMAAGKRPYVFCQGRRTAQIIASAHPEAQVYDAYERGTKDNMGLLYKQRATAPIVVCSCAVDVGISIKDPDGYSIIVIDENVRYLNGIASSAQQVVRDRNPSSREVHILSFDNRLPAPPSFYESVGGMDMIASLHTDEPMQNSVVNHLAARRGLEELSDFQPVQYLQHQLDYAGFSVKVDAPPTVDDATIGIVKALKHDLTTKEKEAMETRAVAILNGHASHWKDGIPIPEADADVSDELTEYNEPMSNDDIRRLGTRALLTPSPYEQLAHERTWEACGAVGFQPLSDFELNLITSEIDDTDYEEGDAPPIADIPDTIPDDRAMHMASMQRQAAIDFVNAGIRYDDFTTQRWGYLAVHHEAVIYDVFDKELGETTHRIDYRRIGYLLQKLLHHIPFDAILSGEELVNVIKSTFDERYGELVLRDMIADGALGIANATKMRFVTDEPTLNEDGELSASAQLLLAWILDFLPRFYPCKLARKGDRFQIHQDPEWTLKMRCIDCTLMFLHNVDDITPNRQELIPTRTEAGDFNPERTAEILKLWQEGHTIRYIADTTGAPRTAVGRTVKGIARERKANDVEDAIIKAMGDGEEHSAKSLGELLSDVTPHKLRYTITQLAKKERIVKAGYGKYTIAS